MRTRIDWIGADLPLTGERHLPSFHMAGHLGCEYINVYLAQAPTNTAKRLPT